MSLQNQWKVPCVLFKCSHLCFFFGEVAISHPQSSRAAPHFVSHSFCDCAPSPLSLCSCSVSLCTVYSTILRYQPLLSYMCLLQGAPCAHLGLIHCNALWLSCSALHSAVPQCRQMSTPQEQFPRVAPLAPLPWPCLSAQICFPLLCQWQQVKCAPPSLHPHPQVPPTPTPKCPPSIPTTGACYTLKVPSLFFPHHSH